MKCAARMHTHDRPEWMRTLEEIRVWIERQIQAVPSILGEARRERSKTERAKTEQAQKLQPSPPPSPSPSLFLSLAFVCSIDTRAESQAATSYRSPRSITYTTMLDVGLCDLWRCDGSIGDFSRRLPRPSRNSRTPREPLLALELGQFLCEGTPREALSLLRLGMARACHRTPINLGIRGASARQLGSSHDRFTARFTQRSIVARCHAPARELTDVAKAP